MFGNRKLFCTVAVVAAARRGHVCRSDDSFRKGAGRLNVGLRCYRMTLDGREYLFGSAPYCSR